VFNLSDDASFHSIYNYYSQLAQFRNVSNLPLLLVGTQGTSVRMQEQKTECRVCNFQILLYHNKVKIVDQFTVWLWNIDECFDQSIIFVKDF